MRVKDIYLSAEMRLEKGEINLGEFEHIVSAEVPEWIPCSERLPDEGADVLAWVEDKYESRIACCNYAKNIWFDAIMDAVVEPVAWQPLPKPYSGEANEKVEGSE